MRIPVLLIGIGLSLAATGCGDSKPTPEQEIRALIREAEIAVEERDPSDFARQISEHYADRKGNDKQSLIRTLRLQIVRNQAIHLLVKTGEINVTENTEAIATVHVAMAGGPLVGFEDLARLRAQLYRFDVQLTKEQGKWRVISASWRRALEKEFL